MPSKTAPKEVGKDPEPRVTRAIELIRMKEPRDPAVAVDRHIDFAEVSQESD